MTAEGGLSAAFGTPGGSALSGKLKPRTRDSKAPSRPAAIPAQAEASEPAPQVSRQGPRYVAVADVAPNPLNPRMIDPDDPEIAALGVSIDENGQIEACAVTTADAYRAMINAAPDAQLSWTEKADLISTIGSAPLVEVTGGRRRMAIVNKGLPKIKIDEDNALARDLDTWLAATLTENIHRANLDPVEEARGIKRMLMSYTGAEVAGRLSKTPAWVTQRKNLLKLEPEVQAALRGRHEERLPLRVVRDWHDDDRTVQLANLRAWRIRAGLTEAEKADTARRPKPAREKRTAVAVAWGRLGGNAAAVAEKLAEDRPREEIRQLVTELTKHLETR